MQALRLLLIMGAALLLAGTGTRLGEAPAAQAAFPGANGKIAFSRGGDIYTVNADGTGEAPLIAGPLTETNPSWSPDGEMIAFGRFDPSDPQLMIANADGGGITQITNADVFDAVSWSPDGTKIAFSRGGGLFIVDVDSRAETQLTNGQQTSPGGPAWSPLGDRIAYHRSVGGDFEIHTIDVNGQNDMTVVGGNAVYPVWSPDGLRIAHTKVPNNDIDGYELRDVAATGGPSHKIVELNGSGNRRGAWSPDGQEIAFADSAAPSGGGYGIFAADVATGQRRQISSLQGDSSPDWQPLPGQCPGTASVSSPSTDDDTDGDNIPDNVENNITHTDPDCQDTDGDGLLDPWEIEQHIEGAGFDLDGDGTPDAQRDEVFGPYNGQCGAQSVGLRREQNGQHCGLVFAPDPLHKDVYVEVDWQDCALGDCPELIGLTADPSHHSPSMAGLMDVVNMFRNAPVENPDGVDGVNLHVLVDEGIPHAHNCDQGASEARPTFFGTSHQRGDAQVMAAREMAFRYAWSGHSSLKATPAECPLPASWEILASGAGLHPLPEYDISPPGFATPGGRDILITLAVSWICQIYTFDLPGFAGNQPPCFRRFPLLAFAPIAPGLFPAEVALANGGAMDVEMPVHLTLGIPPSQGVEQLWGRTMAYYLGRSLGVPTSALGNNPNTPGAQPVNSYGSWSGLSYAPPSGSSAPVMGLTGGDEPIMPDFTLAQQDGDGDGTAEGADNCPALANPGQSDLDMDGQGDACDGDRDGDGALNGSDASPDDTDNDGSDNGADADDDNDGVPDADDNCAVAQNPGQADSDADGAGDACDGDADGDGMPGYLEEVAGSDPDDAASGPEFLGNGQSCADALDNDGDGAADGGDSGCLDGDGDTVPNLIDNCPAMPSRNALDNDGDGSGDACDPDDDNDGSSDSEEREAGTDSLDPESTPAPDVLSGDVDCSGGVTSLDALQVLLTAAGLPANADCLADAGDVDCSDAIDSIDALRILQHIAMLPINLPDGCREIGT